MEILYILVWYDLRDGNEEIYYKRSTNNGINWGSDVRLTNSLGQSNYPAIFVSGLKVRVAWRDTRDGNYEEYYIKSDDGGSTWGSETRLTNAQNTSSIPSIFVFNNNEYIVWHDYRDDPNGNIESEIYFKKSTDNGITWSNDIRLTNAARTSENPSISVSSSKIHIAWSDTRLGLGPQIYYKNSTDNGTTWTTDLKISNNPTSLVSKNACINSIDQNVFIVWNDNRNYHYQIFIKRSTNGGISWGPENSLSNDSTQSVNASLASIDQQLHFVCYDDRNGYSKIYYQKSFDLGLTWSSETKLVDVSNGGSSRPSLCISNNQVNVIWCDTREGNFEIYYKSNPSGLVNINTEITNIKKFTLSQNYPNPFNPVTKIKFDIPVGNGRDLSVKLIIYDILGREVTTLVNEELKPGTYEAEWSAEGGAEEFSSGVYFYKIIAGDYTETKKMVLMK